MWHKISVFQYQQMHPIITNPNKDWTDFDIECKLIAIINMLTDEQVKKLSKKELNKYRAELLFLKDDYKGEKVQRIKANDNYYRFVYEVNDLNAARYIEAKFFMPNLIENLHKAAASMVMPQKRRWFKWLDLGYNTDNHQDYANDILHANFKEVYFSVVFFYQLYKDLTKISEAYLVQGMIQKGMQKEKAEKVAAILCEILDGSIVPN